MEIDEKFLEIICCPETKQDLHLAEDSLIGKLNKLIEEQKLLNRIKQPVKDKLDGGLIREDGKYIYPIIEDIPILLIDESIPLESL
ncbi:MAG: Trm112 family protein [Thermodesulfobacteriota bacterium]